MTDHPALEGIDDIPWADLDACYGPATRFPDLLRALRLDGPREPLDEPLWELFGEIWHQGTIYEATAYVVPFFARLALSEGTPLRDDLLYLLGSVVHGNGEGGAARAAVLEWVPKLVDDVVARETKCGLVAIARLAAAFPKSPLPFRDAVEAMLDFEPDTRVRLAALVQPGHEQADPVLDDLWRELYYEQQ